MTSRICCDVNARSTLPVLACLPSPPSPGKLRQLHSRDPDGQETCSRSISLGARARGACAAIKRDVTEAGNVIRRKMADKKTALLRRRSRFSATPQSSLPSREKSIIRLFVMRMAKSRSLTSENGCKISLTPEDLQNGCFAVFCRNGN